MGESNKVVMDRDDAEEYTRALGQVFGGGWRLVLHAHKQGVPQALGMSTQEWVKERLGGHMQLGPEERKQAAAELTAPEADGGHGLLQQEAAEVLGVTPMTVSRDVRPEPLTNVSEPEPEPESVEVAPPPEPEPLTNVSEPEDAAEVVQEAADALPTEAEAGIRTAQLRSNLSHYWSQTLSGLLQIDPSTAAEVLSPEERQRHLDHLKTMESWADNYKAALRQTGLRVVSK